MLDSWASEVFIPCWAREHPETPEPGSLSRLSPLPVAASEPVRTIPGKGVAGSEAMGPGRRRGTRRPRAARGSPPPHLGAPFWDPGAGVVKARSLLPQPATSPCLTSNRCPAWERDAGAEWPRWVLARPRASGPEGARVGAAWPLLTSPWVRASDRAASGFPPSGLRERASCRLQPLARVGELSRCRGREGPHLCVWGLLPGFPRCSARPTPSPPPRVCFDRKRAAGGEGRPEDVGEGCADASPRLYPQLRGRGGTCPPGPASNPWGGQGWLVLPKAATLCGATSGHSDDLRWHVDERG